MRAGQLPRAGRIVTGGKDERPLAAPSRRPRHRSDLGGALFSGVLRLTEGRRSFDELSLPRFTAWGAVGGLLLGGTAVFASLWGAGGPAVVSGVVVVASAALGAGSAAGTLLLARRAEGRDLLEADTEVADAGLSEAEMERLTGGT